MQSSTVTRAMSEAPETGYGEFLEPIACVAPQCKRYCLNMPQYSALPDPIFTVEMIDIRTNLMTANYRTELKRPGKFYRETDICEVIIKVWKLPA
jgi:hypothetical protein